MSLASCARTEALTLPSDVGADKPQRVRMAAPTAKVGLLKGRMVRNSNKHKRLFDPDEPNGVKVSTATLDGNAKPPSGHQCHFLLCQLMLHRPC